MRWRMIDVVRIGRQALPLFGFTTFFSLLIAEPAVADKRVALVIGNSAYRNVAPLDNPKNDAKLMADTLRALGFMLVGDAAQVDLDKPALDNAVQSFSQKIQGADVGLFYYAGHGVQVRGSNYLVPIGANPTREADVDFQMVDLALVLRQMESAGTKLNLVILDACRNNPFGGRGLRATAGGLAQMQAPEGTLISYATQPGNVAQDGADGNSPYTRALVSTIRKPGLGIFDAFNEVGLAVKRSTAGAQQPWVSSSPIDGKFYFVAPTASAPAPAAATSVAEPATAPGSRIATLSMPQRNPPPGGKLAALIKIAMHGPNDPKAVSAELTRTQGDAWVWTEGRTFNFRSVAESETEIVIFDASRDIYHRFDLVSRVESFRRGPNGDWIRRYDIVRTAAGPLSRIQMRAANDSRAFTAELTRTDGNAWVWAENNGKAFMRSVSESPAAMVLYDSTRDIYHRLDFEARREFFRFGEKPWNKRYAIVKVE